MKLYSVWDGDEEGACRYVATLAEARDYARTVSTGSDSVWTINRFEAPAGWTWRDVFFAHANGEGFATEVGAVEEWVDGRKKSAEAMPQ